MNIDSTVWVLAPIALMVEAKENFSTVLTEVWTVVGVLLKVVLDTGVQFGAFRLLNFSLSLLRQPMCVCSKYAFV